MFGIYQLYFCFPAYSFSQTFQPLENQRLSTSNSPVFSGLNVNGQTNFQGISTFNSYLTAATIVANGNQQSSFYGSLPVQYLLSLQNLSSTGYGMSLRNGTDGNPALTVINASGNQSGISLYGDGRINATGLISSSGLSSSGQIAATTSLNNAFAADFSNSNTNGYGLRVSAGNDGNMALGILNAARSGYNISMYGNGHAYFSNYVTAGGMIQAQSYIDVAAGIYNREHWRTLNKAGNDFLIWGTRNVTGSESVIDLNNIGTVTTSGILNSPQVYIGAVDNRASSYSLAVNGPAIFNKAVIKLYNNWPDFVFDNDYKTPNLLDLEKFIKVNKHLPEIPSAKEVEKDGIDIGLNQCLLLKKIEELTLLLIQQNKRIVTLENK